MSSHKGWILIFQLPYRLLQDFFLFSGMCVCVCDYFCLHLFETVDSAVEDICLSLPSMLP